MRTNKRFLLTLFVLLACAQGVRPAGRTHLYIAGEGGYAHYRIPAMVMTAKGTLLAFAEGRRNGLSDTGDIDLVLRRSTDGGRNWTPTAVVWDDGENVCGNPTPVVLPDGKILLLSTWNRGEDSESQILSRTSVDTRRVFILSSEDDGVTWSKPREITAQVKREADWTWYATGPCHAIVMQEGEHKGRVVVPANHALWSGEGSTYYAHTLYSDDGGENWSIGATFEAVGSSETTVVEFPGGTLLFNSRDERPDREGPGRHMALSRDGGETFYRQYREEMIIEPRCQGAMVNFAPGGKLSHTTLFSSPRDTTERINLKVCASFDYASRWRPNGGYIVTAGPAAYSDLCMLPSGDVAVLYENGKESPYERITYEYLPGSFFEKE